MSIPVFVMRPLKFVLQQLCQQWKDKPESDKKFEPFYSAVHAVAHSSGTRLKTRVQILNSVSIISIQYIIFLMKLVIYRIALVHYHYC